MNEKYLWFVYLYTFKFYVFLALETALECGTRILVFSVYSVYNYLTNFVYLQFYSKYIHLQYISNIYIYNILQILASE